MINDPGVNALEGVVGCGDQLRRAREAAGLSLEEVAGQLHMPVQVVGSLEAERWDRLGAPVFVRGQLRSYARLLKVDLQGLLQQAQIAPIVPPTLVSHTHTPPIRRMAENLGRRAVYVVITAVLAVPVWYVISGSSSKAPPSTASLDVVPPAEAVAGGQASAPSPNGAAQPAAAQQNDPYIASMAPIARPAVAAPAAALALRFKGDSWVEISAPDGSTVEKALIRAGESRSFGAGQVGRMVLGNASDVEVQQASGNVDLAPYKRGNVARFTVSSDGSVAPVSH
ncbi:membrane protein [Stenotrophomonas humi]|uniref:Membrane protein n=1 Tax=Stenotrophomonas humi TaxID=405444 RepID=A0A0R0C1Q4_9GAMM|nr:helix-turn-helix domain-containing protein [Stenotrophomonas humi]KRG63855.1 membrane protein [Stenotrophomonas humi]